MEERTKSGVLVAGQITLNRYDRDTRGENCRTKRICCRTKGTIYVMKKTGNIKTAVLSELPY
jgi:hypothetical protein